MVSSGVSFVAYLHLSHNDRSLLYPLVGLGSVILSGFGNGGLTAPEVFKGAAAAAAIRMGVGLGM